MQRQIVDCSTALESKLPAQPERAHQRTCNSPSTREASGAAHAASPAEGVFHGHSLMHGRCSIMSAHLSAGHCQDPDDQHIQCCAPKRQKVAHATWI